MSEWQIHQSDHKAAAYKDGDLFTAGGMETVMEAVLEYLSAVFVHNDAFLLGQDRLAGCATTLDAIAAYDTETRAKRTRIRDLKQSIRALKDELKELGADDV